MHIQLCLFNLYTIGWIINIFLIYISGTTLLDFSAYTCVFIFLCLILKCHLHKVLTVI